MSNLNEGARRSAMSTRMLLVLWIALLLSLLLLDSGVAAFGIIIRNNAPPPSSSLRLAPQQLGAFEELVEYQESQNSRRVVLCDWSAHDSIPFGEAWNHQKTLVDAHLERLAEDYEASQFHSSSSSSSSGVDTVLFLQHDPVYTLGTASDPSFIHNSNNVPVVRMDRGGEVTYHGPGQLVVYPILDLRGYQQDIHWYMRALEEAVLVALQKAGIDHASRQEDVTGVWISGKKVAAVGIKARRWITLHGLAVNVEEAALANFEGIVPCGLEGSKVTCVNQHLCKPLTVAEFAQYMKEAMENVFCMRLVESDTAFPT